MYCLHMSAVREMVAPIYKHLFILTCSLLCFNAGLPPSFSLAEQQYPVCYWSNIMIKGAVCRTKNRPAIQLCYPAVHCLRQVVSSFPPGRLGQVQLLSCNCSNVYSKTQSILCPVHRKGGCYYQYVIKDVIMLNVKATTDMNKVPCHDSGYNQRVLHQKHTPLP